MTYDISLRKIDLHQDPFFTELEHTSLQEEEANAYDLLMLNTQEAIHAFDEILYTYRYPTTATEGLIASVYDIISTAIRAAHGFIVDVVKWLSKKIKFIVSFRKKQKQYRDKKFETLLSIYTGLTPQQKIEADQKFNNYTINYTPSSTEYIKMCLAFSQLIKIINDNIDLYMSKDIAIFEVDDKKSKPTWISGLYDNNDSRESLKRFGINYENNSFVQISPFKTLLSSTLTELEYKSIEQVKIINTNYISHCWANLRHVVGLRDRLEKFERELKEKQRELGNYISKVDETDVLQACKNVMLSASLAGKLTAYLTSIDEALDTRRGWLIDKAITACGSHTEENNV